MSRPPKVSVLIPTYNFAQFLPECLESILTQDFRDLEVLVMDNGSADDTQAVVQRFLTRSSCLRYLRNPRNLGLTANLNRCLAEAKGELIKFVFADDKLASPDAVSQLVALLEGHPSAVLAASAARIINRDSQPLYTRNRLGKSGLKSGRSVMVRCLETNRNLIGEPSLA